MKFTLVPLTVLVLTSPTTVHGSERPIVATPNIVVIVADDLGWGHVGWRNPTVKTPNLDRLAAKGIKLNQHYVAPFCSPTRVALMTRPILSPDAQIGLYNVKQH